jgi:anaerobic selenocysteine-containing dehydrogenase
MQGVVEHFFASYGATLSEGSLCDGAGAVGIMQGRGSNKNISLEEIKKAEVVVFWGRNPHTTSPHLIPLIKNKKIIVIDPIKTQTAKMADLFLQIKPGYDIYFAMLLTRFLHIQYDIDEEYLEEFASEYEDFYELTQEIRIVQMLDEMDLDTSDIVNFLDMVVGKKCVIMCGIGVQKYEHGVDTLRAIDALGVHLGLFKNEGSGVVYLSNSQDGIDLPFFQTDKKISKVNTPFEKFDMVFIQGANPLSQMPETKKVEASLNSVENIVYFGLWENQTSKKATLVIPSKPFLYKNDVRLSYLHSGMMFMPKVGECDWGIDEYTLSKELCKYFDVKIQSESEYLEYFKSFATTSENDLHVVKFAKDLPYINGFDTKDKEFCFLDELDVDVLDEEGYYLITSKAKSSLNSQFHICDEIFIHPDEGFTEGEEVEVSSKFGNGRFFVSNSKDVKKGCVLIYSGAKNLNYLTTSKHAIGAKSAIFQNQKVKITKV